MSSSISIDISIAISIPLSLYIYIYIHMCVCIYIYICIISLCLYIYIERERERESHVRVRIHWPLTTGSRLRRTVPPGKGLLRRLCEAPPRLATNITPTKLTLLESNFPGDSLWAWEFHPFNLI